MDNSTADQMVLTGNNLAPTNNLESALVQHLAPGEYTAIVSGKGTDTGVALVEVYDIDPTSVPSELANISTRGIVGTVDDVLIGGLIVGPSGGTDLGNATVVVRAIGPSLTSVSGALADPFLALHNADGDVIAMNDNWADDPNAGEIQTLNLAPSDALEAATLVNLIGGEYTAIVMGNNNSIGVALVEVYHVPPQTAH